jgi:hypothetical protein
MASSSFYHAAVTGLLTAMLATMATVGCSKSESPVDDTVMANDLPNALPSATKGPANRFAAWQGRWNGVEGMYVDITPLGGGKYRLEMQHGVDAAAIYVGQDDEQGIRFTRNQTPLMIISGPGDESDLRYLKGKKDCLIVKQYEGYCRG